MTRAIVIGGGIGGLTAAHELAERWSLPRGVVDLQYAAQELVTVEGGL